MDDEIAESYLLDSIITLVDAGRMPTSSSIPAREARRQGFCRPDLISKADPVTPDELADLQHRLKHMNPRAPQKTVHFGEVALGMCWTCGDST